MTLELPIIIVTKSEDTSFVLVEYISEINKQSSNFKKYFNFLVIDTDA